MLPIVLGALLVAVGSLTAWILSKREDHAVGTSSTRVTTTNKAPSQDWLTYGRTNARPHASAVALRPPFRRLWSVYGDSSFIEFPPVVAAGRLYFGTDHGRVVAVETRGGNLIWERQLGHCIAASPALRARTLLVAAMGPPPCNRGLGVLVALDAHTGRLRWRFLTAPIESSPLVVGSLVVVGARNGYVYAVDLRTGDVRWRYKTSAAVKGSAAAADGVVYIGSYDGYVYALLAATGRLRWRAPSLSGARGRFYATPTVAGGHVFIGATDGIFYSFAARSGRVEWSRRLPSFIYASAAIAGGRVYVGSYDHRLYALDASSGRILWSYLARGPVSGAPTVLDGLVYFSSCGSCSRYESDPAARRTYALDARSGRQAWSFADGEYSPVVTDGTQLYLTGYTRVYALEPERRRPSG